MRVAILSVSAGAIVGALTVGGVTTSHNGSRAQDDRQQEVSTPTQGGALVVFPIGDRSSTVTFSDRLSIYRTVDDLEGVDALEAALEDTLGMAPSYSRDATIDALLARFAYTAPTRALSFSRTLELNETLLSAVFKYAALIDTEATLAQLALVENQSTRIAVALEVLDALGDRPHVVQRITEALGSEDRADFQIERLVRLASWEPEAAFDELLHLQDSFLYDAASRRIAEAWAQSDPIGALAKADLLAPVRSSDFRSWVSAEWARLDSVSFLRFVESNAPSSDISGGIRVVMASDPEGLIRAAEMRPDGTSLKMVAFNALAYDDPAAAAARAGALRPDRGRDSIVSMVALAYSRQDPEAALAWLASLSPPVERAQTAVAMAIAKTDINRALDMMAASPGANAQTLLNAVFDEIRQDPNQAAKMASDLVGRSDETGNRTLSRLLITWMEYDRDSALQWIQRGSEGVDPRIVGAVARELASHDLGAAETFSDRVPDQFREAWVIQVAQIHGRSDPEQALRFIQRFSGQPFYRSAYSGILAQYAQTDPQGAVALLPLADLPTQRSAVGPVAAQWARVEPELASRWALGLSDVLVRATAVRAIAAVWLESDPQATRQWTSNLPSGEIRDAALTALLASSESERDIEDITKNFSSATARQQAIEHVLPVIIRLDRQRAKRLVDNYVTDAAVRAQLIYQIQDSSGVAAP